MLLVQMKGVYLTYVTSKEKGNKNDVCQTLGSRLVMDVRDIFFV